MKSWIAQPLTYRKSCPLLTLDPDGLYILDLTSAFTRGERIQRSPAQRKTSCLSPTHSTSAQTVLKLEENTHANTGCHVPIDLECFPLNLSLPDNMAVLA